MVWVGEFGCKPLSFVYGDGLLLLSFIGYLGHLGIWVIIHIYWEK